MMYVRICLNHLFPHCIGRRSIEKGKNLGWDREEQKGSNEVKISTESEKGIATYIPTKPITLET